MSEPALDASARRLAKLRPRLQHVTQVDVQTIFAEGLLSTRSLLEKAGWDERAIAGVTEQRRDDFVLVDWPSGRETRLSHQRPIKLKMLNECLGLTGTPIEEYFRLLANRVFLFPEDGAAAGFKGELLGAGAVDIMCIDTVKLLRAVGDRVEVSAYNSGSTPRSPLPKGRDTWLEIAAFGRPFRDVKEVTVLDEVQDVESMTVQVVREYHNGNPRE